MLKSGCCGGIGSQEVNQMRVDSLDRMAWKGPERVWSGASNPVQNPVQNPLMQHQQQDPMQAYGMHQQNQHQQLMPPQVCNSSQHYHAILS